MKFFGWKSAGREASRPALARGLAWGVASAEVPPSYAVQAYAAYANNPVAQRAVRLIAEAVGGAPLVASDEAALALVQTVTGGQMLTETVAAQILLHGNAFVQKQVDSSGRLSDLFALRPERVRIEGDARGWPCGFMYRIGENVMRFPLDQIIHIRAMNPFDDHYGLGCLGAVSGAVSVHNAASVWNKALLDNAARPSGALVYDPGEPGATLSAEQFDRLRAEFEASFAGATNAGRPMLLEGGLKWQALSLSPAEMDFLGTKAAAARDIALGFGVPPVLLGLPGDATYANYREANRALWRQTILPLADKILRGIAQGLGTEFPGLTLSIDLDRVPELAEDRERLWSALSGADFLSAQEKRAMLGLPSPLAGEG
jgi:HK97 family phage portal protein